MTCRKCRRCARWWTLTTNPAVFEVIGKFCPDCVAAVFPIMGGGR